jgi:hypothetical protein
MWWWLAAWLVGGPVVVQGAGAAPVQAATEEFRAVRVEIVGFDEEALLAALRLRLARQAVARHGGAAPTESPHAYVQVTREANGEGRLRAITSDGRAYERLFEIEVGQEVRVAASTAANLVFAIEQGAVAPDQVDVEIPVTAAVTEMVEPEAVPEVKPEAMKPAPAPVVTAPVVRAPGWELAVGLHGAGVLAVGAPRYAGALAGAGGGLGVELRGRRGGALALDVRGLGRGGGEFSLGRVRVGVAGGYVWRRGMFELPVFVGAAIEPWWTRRSGEAAIIYRGETAVARSPLFGGFLRVVPAARIPVARGRLAAVRVGPFVEVAGSFAVDGGAKVVGLADDDGVAQVRLGGLEVALGLTAALEFSLGQGL